MAKSKMSLKELSHRVGISMTNLSLLKTGKVKAIRFSTLAAICKELNCQPGDILQYVAGTREETAIEKPIDKTIEQSEAGPKEPNS